MVVSLGSATVPLHYFMASTTALADTITRPIFELCNPREERFLRDLMRQISELEERRKLYQEQYVEILHM